jgi:hypothetical protein
MTEEAFALLNEAAIPVQPSSPVPTAALNPLYFAAPTKV